MEHGVVQNWLEKAIEVIIGSLLRVLIPLAFVTLFVIMVLGWIVEDIWKWLRGKPMGPSVT
jgi:hypothetical protein